MAHLLGIDLGSSSVKVALVEADSGRFVASAQSPTGKELQIKSTKAGWAEQDPELWWQHTCIAIDSLAEQQSLKSVSAIGIGYQMHGLVLLDENGKPVRPSIIWCDSRAVALGDEAARKLGPDVLELATLNSPGNFTASKWAWVAQHEPETLARASSAMLPGDYIAYRLTGRRATTASGLSEMVLWDFAKRAPTEDVLKHYGLNADLLPALVPTFGEQGTLDANVAAKLNLPASSRVTYRAGDQPNNAYSLNVLEPGEVAATAGTSGVVYAVSGDKTFDQQQRVNTFLHVNDLPTAERLGVLLCINGTGSAYAWLRRTLGAGGKLPDYPQLNAWAEQATIGSDGLLFYPWGNGAERVLGNQDRGARFVGLNFNRHHAPQLTAAVQDGIAAALAHGAEALTTVGAKPTVVRAGRANLFLSDRFCQAFSQLIEAPLELYDTDGAQGAARAAGVGSGDFQNHAEALQALQCIGSFEPKPDLQRAYQEFFKAWQAGLRKPTAS